MLWLLIICWMMRNHKLLRRSSQRKIYCFGNPLILVFLIKQLLLRIALIVEYIIINSVSEIFKILVYMLILIIVSHLMLINLLLIFLKKILMLLNLRYCFKWIFIWLLIVNLILNELVISQSMLIS